MREWSIGRRMQWARDAYWYGATEYALDILMEIAQEEINNHVQETFDLSCQPKPVKKKTVRTGTGGKPSGFRAEDFPSLVKLLEEKGL